MSEASERYWPEWGKAVRQSGCRERSRHVRVLLGMEAGSLVDGRMPGLGSVPDAGSAGRAGAPLVVPGLGWVVTLILSWWLGRSMHGLAGSGRDSRAGRTRGRGWGPGSGGRGWRRLRGGGHRGATLARIGRRIISHVVPQGRPDDLPAPLRASPSGEFGPRQHLVDPRGISLGDLEPNRDAA
jgi:hypothetical protein